MKDALRNLARAEAGRQIEPTAAIIDTQSVKTAAVYVEKLFVDSGYAGPKLQDALKELGVSELIEIALKPEGVSTTVVSLPAESIFIRGCRRTSCSRRSAHR